MQALECLYALPRATVIEYVSEFFAVVATFGEVVLCGDELNGHGICHVLRHRSDEVLECFSAEWSPAVGAEDGAQFDREFQTFNIGENVGD